MKQKTYPVNILFLITVFFIFSGFFTPEASSIDNNEEELLGNGDRAYKFLNYSKAYDYFNNAIKNNPELKNDAVILLKIAVSALKTGKNKIALDWFTKAEGIPNDYLDYIDLHKAFALEELDKEAVLAELNDFENKYPASLLKDEARYKRGMINYILGNYAASEKDLLLVENSRVLIEGKAKALLYLGKACINQQKITKGLDYLVNLMDKSSGNPSAFEAAVFIDERITQRETPPGEKELIFKAVVYANNDNRSKANSLFAEYFKRFPEGDLLGRALYERGKYRFNRNMATASIDDFRKSYDLLKDPALARYAMFYLARATLRKGDRTGGIEAYNRYAKFFPTDRRTPEALWMVGLTHERQKAFEKAAIAYQKTADLSQSIAYRNRALFRVGFIYYKHKQYSKAENYFKNVFRKYPGEEIGMQSGFWQAKSFEKLGNKAAADSIYTILARKKIRSFYIIRSREKTGISENYIQDYGTDISRAVYSPEIAKTVEAGSIFRGPWSLSQLRSIRRKVQRNSESLLQLHNAYVDMGKFKEAITLMDFVYNRYYYGKNNEDILKALYPMHFTDIINEVPRANRMDKALIYSIIRRESLFEYDAVSSVGAIGLMQLMPYTAKTLSEGAGLQDFKDEDVYLPEVNIRLGIQNISELLQRFRKNFPHAIAAYNAGDDPVRRWMKNYGTKDMDEWIENIEYLQTQIFVKEVLKNHYYFSNLYPEMFN